MTTMVERGVAALSKCCETETEGEERSLDEIPMPDLVRAVLHAALDPEDEALVEMFTVRLVALGHPRATNPSQIDGAQHFAAGFISVLRRIAEERVSRKDASNGDSNG